MKITKLIAILAFGLFSTTIFAQANTSQDIENHLNTLIEQGNDYQEYKVIKENRLKEFKADLSTFLTKAGSDLATTQNKVEEQQEEIDELKNELQEVKDELAQVNQEKEEISFLMFSTDKAQYKTIMWSIAGGLLLLLMFFIFKYQRSNQVTRETRRKLMDSENEFITYKRRALKKEQNLTRQLQDELNKQM